MNFDIENMTLKSSDADAAIPRFTATYPFPQLQPGQGFTVKLSGDTNIDRSAFRRAKNAMRAFNYKKGGKLKSVFVEGVGLKIYFPVDAAVEQMKENAKLESQPSLEAAKRATGPTQFEFVSWAKTMKIGETCLVDAKHIASFPDMQKWIDELRIQTGQPIRWKLDGQQLTIIMGIAG